MNGRFNENEQFSVLFVLRRRPDAVCVLKGGKEYPCLRGTVKFYQTKSGAVVYAQTDGLPEEKECGEKFFGFHIHSGGSCGGDDMFSLSGSHYNPDGCPHPCHSGDMPPLLGSGGRAVLIFLTDKFSVNEVIGKTVIIHSKPDDFTTQPSGNAGDKIACGVICKNKAGGNC